MARYPVWACESGRHGQHKSFSAAAHCSAIARRERLARLKPVPDDFPVKVLTTREDKVGAGKLSQCLHCERMWDDSISTKWTPTPSGRCPFEYYH